MNTMNTMSINDTVEPFQGSTMMCGPEPLEDFGRNGSTPSVENPMLNMEPAVECVDTTTDQLIDDELNINL